MSESQRFDQITVRDKDGNTTKNLEKPWLGDLTMRQEGGRSVIETTDWWGNTKTYVPSQEESIEATRY